MTAGAVHHRRIMHTDTIPPMAYTIPQPRERLIREPERRSITGVSRAQWARLELARKAPHRIYVSERIVAWRLTELERWVELTARGEEWNEPGGEAA